MDSSCGIAEMGGITVDLHIIYFQFISMTQGKHRHGYEVLHTICNIKT